MAKIWTLAAQKGGVGKSTLAFSIYSAAHHGGLKVVAIDLDPQGTLTTFSRLPNVSLNLKEAPMGVDEIAGFLKNLAGSTEYDMVIVDTPGWRSQEMDQVFQVSDLVLVPVCPGAADVFAIAPTWQQLQYLGVNAAVVFNRVKHATRGFVAELRAGMEEGNMRVLKTEIADRVNYQRSVFGQGSVFDTEDEKAQEEILELLKEVIGNGKEN